MFIYDDIYKRLFILRILMSGCYTKALEEDKERLLEAMHDDFEKVVGPLKARLQSASTIDAIIESFREWLRSFEEDVIPDDMIWLLATDAEVAGIVQGFLETNSQGQATS